MSNRFSTSATAIILAGFASCIVPASHAQQDPGASPRAPRPRQASQALQAPQASRTRQNFYGRTESRPTSASMSRTPAVGRAIRGEGVPDEDAPQGVVGAPRGRNPVDVEAGDRDDPLRHYGNRGREVAGRVDANAESTGYSSPVAIPERTVPQARHNYFPGIRVGQAPNRNIPTQGHRCVPGRHQVLGGARPARSPSSPGNRAY